MPTTVEIGKHTIKNQLSTRSASVLGEKTPVSKAYSKAFILAEEITRTGESFQWSKIELLVLDENSNPEIGRKL